MATVTPFLLSLTIPTTVSNRVLDFFVLVEIFFGAVFFLSEKEKALSPGW